MGFLRYFPLLAIHLGIFNLTVLLYGDDAAAIFNHILIRRQLYSGAILSLTINDLLVITAIGSLYLEVLKATHVERGVSTEHLFSVFVFIAFLLEFVLVRSLGTKSFLMVGLLSLLDVMAGFTVSISAARRDIGVG